MVASWNRVLVARWLTALGVVGTVALPAVSQGPPPAHVRLDEVRLETVEQRRAVTGEVRAVRQSAVASEEEGLVMSLEVDVGAEVEAGQVMARLNDRLRVLEFEQRRALAMSKRAEVDEEMARREKAARDLGRVEELEQRAGASRNEADDARTALAEAEARVARAEAELAHAEAQEQWAARRVAYMEIKAPFDGMVVRKGTEVGQWVDSGSVVVELVALDEVDIYLDVPERFLDALRSSAAEVQLQLPALKETISATTFTVVASGDRLARTFPVRVRLPNADGRLKPGMSVIGMTPTGEPVEALTVHKDAVMRNEAGSFVWFDGGGVARVATIDALFAVGDRIAVRSPLLKAGMNVLVEGNERVYPGQPIAPIGGGGAASGAVAEERAEGR